MGVDVDAGRIDLQIEHESRVAAVVQHVLIRLAHGVRQQPVANGAAVDKEILLIRLAARESRLGNPAVQSQTGTGVVHRHQLADERLSQQRPHALQLLFALSGTQVVERFALAAHDQLDVRTAQCDALDHPLQVLLLGRLTAQELAPRRYVEEQVAHLDGRALGVRHRLRRHRLLAPVTRHLPAAVGLGGAGLQQQTRHGGDARQRLAAKTEAGHALQIVQGADLAGGMARQCQCQVFAVDAAAVVAHPHQASSAVFDVDFDPCGAGVETVLQQFLEHRRRPLDDFAGGDLIYQLGIERMDSCHVAPRSACASRNALWYPQPPWLRNRAAALPASRPGSRSGRREA